MKVSMSFPNRAHWGKWGTRKKISNSRGKAKSTKLRNKKGYKAFLDAYTKEGLV